MESDRHKFLHNELYMGITHNKFLILLCLSAGIEHFSWQLSFIVI